MSSISAPNTSLGIGQSWLDMSGQRAANTTYQNTSYRPIEVSIVSANAYPDRYIQVSADGVSWINLKAGAGASERIEHQFTVPPGHYYRTSADMTIAGWAELR
ncbi:MAG: hypothetical protein JJ938_17605 [Roseicyclus sp.]|nr:hypothetical protein [Roseicyclus sp.]MBO6626693.1 hypothetical protein [Roseicyclus sp.]MBO6922357.1 hypothetical protein [Roseicyclus sp.]